MESWNDRISPRQLFIENLNLGKRARLRAGLIRKASAGGTSRAAASLSCLGDSGGTHRLRGDNAQRQDSHDDLNEGSQTHGHAGTIAGSSLDFKTR